MYNPAPRHGFSGGPNRFLGSPLCIAPSSTGSNCFSYCELWYLPAQLNRTTMFHSDCRYLYCGQEIVSRQTTGAVVLLTSCISLLSRITVLHCLLDSAWNQLTHIFCPVWELFWLHPESVTPSWLEVGVREWFLVCSPIWNHVLH